MQSSVRARFNVFISHAGPQKDFALWIRSHVRICGYRAFVDEHDLQCGSCSPTGCFGISLGLLTETVLLIIVLIQMTSVQDIRIPRLQAPQARR